MSSEFCIIITRILAAVPIFGAFFADEKKVNRFITELCMFCMSVLFLAMMNEHDETKASCHPAKSIKAVTIDETCYDMDTDMEMHLHDDMLMLPMFLLMYARMRCGAMLGEAIGNFFLFYCYENRQSLENATWRDNFLVNFLLVPLPIIGAYFESNKISHFLHSLLMDLSMYGVGTAAMMLPDMFFVFTNLYLRWVSDSAAMYAGMAGGMVAAESLVQFSKLYYKGVRGVCNSDLSVEEEKLLNLEDGWKTSRYLLENRPAM